MKTWIQSKFNPNESVHAKFLSKEEIDQICYITFGSWWNRADLFFDLSFKCLGKQTKKIFTFYHSKIWTKKASIFYGIEISENFWLGLTFGTLFANNVDIWQKTKKQKIKFPLFPRNQISFLFRSVRHFLTDFVNRKIGVCTRSIKNVKSVFTQTSC